MGVIGISLVVATVVYVLIKPPSWLPPWYVRWRGGNLGSIAPPKTLKRNDEADSRKPSSPKPSSPPPQPPPPAISFTEPTNTQSQPPAPPLIQVQADEETTPKAEAAKPPALPVPKLSLDDTSAPTPAIRAPAPSSSGSSSSSASSMMPPPAVPNRRPPTLPSFPAANSPQRASGPLPNRGGPSRPSSGLALPPTHSSVPQKPSRKVLLTPGHSPLDWARVSGSNADLRGVPPSTPYLRVTPSMLKRQTGRKGKDAWMALNGKVYNVTPYADFHPGGVPELMRGAGRDGTKLFGEVHPWVNYENMLTSCLVGLLVDEAESEMDKMD